MTKSHQTEITHKIIVIVVLLLGFLLRVYHLSFQPIWSDEADVIRFANEPIINLIRNINRPGWNGPVFYLSIRPWLSVIGGSSFGLRFFSVVFATMTVAATYVLGKWILGYTNGVIASLFVATSPYLVWYAQDGKMYSLLLFLSIISTLLVFRASKKGHWYIWGLYILLTWYSWYIHILAILLLPFQLVVWITYNRKFAVWRILALSTIIGILYIPIFRWQFPAWLSPFTTGHEFLNILEIIRTQIFVFTVGYPSPVQYMVIPLFFFLFLFGCFNMTRETILFSAYFFLPLLVIYLISFGMPIYTDRYLIMTAPAFYCLCAFGLTKLLNNKSKMQVGLLSFLIACNCFTIYLQANTIIKSAIHI